jgi:hypothetical protein
MKNSRKKTAMPHVRASAKTKSKVATPAFAQPDVKTVLSKAQKQIAKLREIANTRGLDAERHRYAALTGMITLAHSICFDLAFWYDYESLLRPLIEKILGERESFPVLITRLDHIRLANREQQYLKANRTFEEFHQVVRSLLRPPPLKSTARVWDELHTLMERFVGGVRNPETLSPPIEEAIRHKLLNPALGNRDAVWAGAFTDWMRLSPQCWMLKSPKNPLYQMADARRQQRLKSQRRQNHAHDHSEKENEAALWTAFRQIVTERFKRQLPAARDLCRA